ncbi:MAG: hypothetical protein ACPG6V_02040 [Flavobacteriales bacterium]
MFKFNKKKKGSSKNTPQPLFYFDEILDMIDIANGAFYQKNESFILIISSDKHEDVLQIINKNMAEETSENPNEFGISLSLEFDTEEESDLNNIKKLKQHKNFGSFIKREDENLMYFTLLLPHDSEQAASICSSIMTDVFGNKKNDQVRGDFYEIE